MSDTEITFAITLAGAGLAVSAGLLKLGMNIGKLVGRIDDLLERVDALETWRNAKL